MEATQDCLQQLMCFPCSYRAYGETIQKCFLTICQENDEESLANAFFPHISNVLARGMYVHDYLGMSADEHDDFFFFLSVLHEQLFQVLGFTNGLEYLNVILDIFYQICLSLDVSIKQMGVQALKELITSRLTSVSSCTILVAYFLSRIQTSSTTVHYKLCRDLPLLIDKHMFLSNELFSMFKDVLRSYIGFLRSQNLSLRQESVLQSHLCYERCRCVREYLKRYFTQQQDMDSSRSLQTVKRYEEATSFLITCEKEILNAIMESYNSSCESLRLLIPEILAKIFKHLDDAALQHQVLDMFHEMKGDTSHLLRAKLWPLLVPLGQDADVVFKEKYPKYLWKALQDLLHLLKTGTKDTWTPIINMLASEDSFKDVFAQLTLKQQGDFLELFHSGLQSISLEDGPDQLFCLAENLIPIACLFDSKLAIQHLSSSYTYLYSQVDYPEEVAALALKSLTWSCQEICFSGNGSEFLSYAVLEHHNQNSALFVFSHLHETAFQFLQEIENFQWSVEALQKSILSIQWRIRHTLLLLTPLLLPYISKDSLLFKFFSPFIISCFSDQVHLIRSTACNCSAGLFRLQIKSFQKEIFDCINSLLGHSNYLYRMVHVHFQNALLFSSLVFKHASYYNMYYNLFCSGLKDSISNVRLEQFMTIHRFIQQPGSHISKRLLTVWKDACQMSIPQHMTDVKEYSFFLLNDLESFIVTKNLTSC